MAGILYFRSGSTVRVTLDDVRALGLEHAYDRQPTSREQIGCGPSGKSGVVFADPDRMGAGGIGYYPDQQTWEAVPVEEGEPVLWIGFWNDNRPSPQDLARKEQVTGPRVRLADGQEWMVPLVQHWEEDGKRCALPQVVKRLAKGTWVCGEIVPKYRAIWEASQRFWGVLMSMYEAAAGGDRTEDYQFDGLYDFASELLGLNYAIGPLEVSALGLFTSDDMAQNVILQAISWPVLMDWLKKNAAASGDDSSAGETA